MEYRFIVPSEPTSEAPSEYHSDTEEIEMEEIQKGRRREGREGSRVKEYTIAWWKYNVMYIRSKTVLNGRVFFGVPALLQ